MKPPKNYYNSLDRMKQDLDTSTLPDVTSSDAGKVLKVSEAGGWELADDENTIIEANPEDTPTIDLNSLKIGSTTYSVKDAKMDYIKAFRITISNGGQYLTNKPIIDFYDEAGNKAAITSSDYTVTCDKTYQGNANMDQVCSISTPNTPGTFTYIFNNDFDTATYKLIKLTRGGAFPADIAKNIMIELSADGTNFIEIYDETTITWSEAVPYHLISLKDGSEASTLLPIVTSADNGKVLGVVNGEWDKMTPSSDNTYDLIYVTVAGSPALTITPGDPTADDPYDIYEYTFSDPSVTGYKNDGTSDNIKNEFFGSGVGVKYSTLFTLSDGFHTFRIKTPIGSKLPNFKNSSIASVFPYDRFPVHFDYNSTLSLAAVNAMVSIESLTTTKLVLHVYK